MEEALKKKDQDLSEARKEALNKTKLAEEKLASVGTLEKENSRLKTTLDTANQEVSHLKHGNIALNDKESELAGRGTTWRLISVDSPRSCSSCSRVITPARLTCSYQTCVEPLTYP